MVVSDLLIMSDPFKEGSQTQFTRCHRRQRLAEAGPKKYPEMFLLIVLIISFEHEAS